MKLKNPREFFGRVVLLMIGLIIAHLGVTLFLLSDLGSDPFNVLIQGLFRKLGVFNLPILTHGRVHICISFLIILILLLVDRSYVRIGTLLCMIFGGPIIDLWSLIFDSIINSNSAFAIRVVVLALGCAILAFGMTIVIKSEAGTGPNDLVAVVISDKLTHRFGITRVIVDFIFAIIGLLLGGTIGIGTVICAFMVGPIAQKFLPISEKICNTLLKRMVNLKEVS